MSVLPDVGVDEPVVEAGCVVRVVCVDAEEVLAEEAVVLEGTALVDAVPALVPASVLCTGCFVVGDAASSVNYYYISYYIYKSTSIVGFGTIAVLKVLPPLIQQSCL